MPRAPPSLADLAPIREDARPDALMVLVTVVPCFVGSSWRTPNGYPKVGIRRGTTSTKPGTTSSRGSVLGDDVHEGNGVRVDV
jgi:hypothetical protein